VGVPTIPESDFAYLRRPAVRINENHCQPAANQRLAVKATDYDFFLTAQLFPLSFQYPDT